MSYSFEFTVPNKAAAKERVAAELGAVVQSQPCHAQDHAAALAAAHAFIDCLVDDDSQDVKVTMHGSVGYTWSPDISPEDWPLRQAGTGVNVFYVPKAQETA